MSSLENHLLRRTGKLKKALIFDCDNTLWKGVIGEDGMDGIDMSSKSEIGVNFLMVQKLAVSLSQKGVLICLCSKNNPEDVDSVLTNHKGMFLGTDHIVGMKVNWNTKDENLKSLAEELNIGLDSFVFIDDSDFEINLIKTNVPEVLAVTVPKDISKYPSLVMEIAQRYFNLEPLKEDIKKLKIYKEQAKRTEAKKSFMDIDSYLATLETRVTISENDESQIPRVAQLTQKTNQFNLTTKRYTENDISGFMSGNSSVLTIDVSDKFGDSGVTGVIILKELTEDTVEIDSYLLSCRILGRKIEIYFLDFVLEMCKKKGYKTVKSTYSKTTKNDQVKDFFQQNQFLVERKSETQATFTLSLTEYRENKINFITLFDKTTKN